MQVKTTNNGVIVENTEIAFLEFCDLVTDHLRCNPDTASIEKEALQLVLIDFTEQQLESFVRHVCKWGGYAGIAGRILNQNSIATIRKQFRNANGKLAIRDIQGALTDLNCVRGLGSPSFASKHLRFLRPEICPVMDSIISQRLNYSFTTQGYELFAGDCAKIGMFLEDNRVTNPMKRVDNKWYAADVEMALFAHLNNF